MSRVKIPGTVLCEFFPFALHLLASLQMGGEVIGLTEGAVVPSAPPPPAHATAGANFTHLSINYDN